MRIALMMILVAFSFESKEGLSASYDNGVVRIVFRNETKSKQSIALLKRGLPIMDIEESGWFSWTRVYPKGKALRLKAGDDVVRPGRAKVYKFAIELDPKKTYRLDIHGFGGTEIRMK